MKDYEVLHIPNGRMPNIGLLRLTVSETRVGLYMPVLDALGRPDGIIIHRGINGNEGKLVIEAAEYDPDDPNSGVIPLDYGRKKIDFYNREFVETCKEMIRRYGRGEFTRGIYFTVKGVREGETTIMFDFSIVASRVVSAVDKPKKRSANGRIAGRRSASASTSRSGNGQSGHSRSEKAYNTMAGQALSGFSMPAMGRTY